MELSLSEKAVVYWLTYCFMYYETHEFAIPNQKGIDAEFKFYEQNPHLVERYCVQRLRSLYEKNYIKITNMDL